jgi:hypothetical protein
MDARPKVDFGIGFEEEITGFILFTPVVTVATTAAYESTGTVTSIGTRHRPESPSTTILLQSLTFEKARMIIIPMKLATEQYTKSLGSDIKAI